MWEERNFKMKLNKSRVILMMGRILLKKQAQNKIIKKLLNF